MSSLAIVTGANKGIGKAAAEQFIKEGWDIINISRTPSDLKGVINIKIDLAEFDREEKSLDQFEFLLKERKVISLIHNAFDYYASTVLDCDMTVFDKSFQVNIFAPILLEKIIIPHMKKGSSILYLCSTLSEMAVKNCMPYVLCKHAIVGLMRANCQDLSNRGIHVACICPGFTETEMLKTHLKSANRGISDIARHIALNRLVPPSEIASFIYYCAVNPVINGSVLHANLGFINQ